ncbi:transcription initiation factor TFIID subunit 9B [Lingula anatina]|uniref:Transcription initiation factor TFIID subunit 9B n=1 Tax=Lingula anatina TaxID=7574 RepID=A0A1S3KFZ4_LINAN|nr:transcription initiation factor TFIID subunit 9B [Lingula anatina]|eukprot:XP_013421558.1 transcription initiation factor TFIID subunit 9B [Lingula anatina]
MAAPTKSTPKDAQVMASILKDMGVTDYEPRVINQMLEFTYRYVTDVLDDAKVYANHAGKKNIDTEDVKLAIQCKLDHSYTTPPPKDLLMEVAKHRNSQSLPLIKPYTGPKLPPDRYCLSSTNYKLKALKKPRLPVGLPASAYTLSSPKIITSGGVSKNQPLNLASMGGTSLSVVSKGVSMPTVTLVTKQGTSSSAAAMPMPTIRLTTTPSQSNPLKRKAEDDDYDKPS